MSAYDPRAHAANPHRRRAQALARYRQLRDAGKCPGCGRVPEQGRVYCRPCLDARRSDR